MEGPWICRRMQGWEVSIVLRAQKTGLEGRVGRTSGVKGRKHKEQLQG